MRMGRVAGGGVCMLPPFDHDGLQGNRVRMRQVLSSAWSVLLLYLIVWLLGYLLVVSV